MCMSWPVSILVWFYPQIISKWYFYVDILPLPKKMINRFLKMGFSLSCYAMIVKEM